jgi:hypothetical protein
VSVSAALLNLLRVQTRDLSVVVEIYPPTTIPGADGFDPADADMLLASVSGIELAGNSYTRLLDKVGSISRSSGPTFNNCSLDVVNHDRAIATYILNQPRGIEGYHLVCRLVSRSQSLALTDTIALFTGRLEKAIEGSKESISFTGKQHLGSTENGLPHRQFSPDDELHDPDDDEFEGFRYVPSLQNISFDTRERGGGLLGLLFGKHKTVHHSDTYSSQSSLQADVYVPWVFGRTQMLGMVIAGIDIGTIIIAIRAWCQGPIEGYFNPKILTDGFTWLAVASGTNPGYRYGEVGGYTADPDRSQTVVVSPAPFPGNRPYSHTAWEAEAFAGSKQENNDPIPDVSTGVIGMRMPVPDDMGVFPLLSGATEDLKWTDNPAYITRFILTHPKGFALDPAFIDDAVCIETAQYCDHYLEDEANTDRVVVQSGEEDFTFRVVSTSRLTPEYIRRFHLADDTVNPWTVEALDETDPTLGYATFDPFDTVGPTLTPIKALRRRYTCNMPLTDQVKVIDLLYKMVFPTARLYLVQGENSKIQIRVKKPVDNTILRANTLAGVTEIPVQSVMAWIDDLSGKILIGHASDSPEFSEVRPVTGIRYDADGNDITLAVSGALTRSGATFTGGDDDTPATASVTVTGTGGGTITIDGVAVGYTGTPTDTTGTIAFMLAAAVNASPTLNSYVKAEWDSGAPTIVTLTAKIGWLQFDRALEYDHAETDQIIRVKASYCDEGFSGTNDGSIASQSDCVRANIIKGSFKWPLGSQQSTYNQATGTYKDASQDYKPVTLKINDTDHQTQIGKVVPLEVDLSGVDNHHQATRILNGYLAEYRDGDFFTGLTLDGEALTHLEGDVICVSERSGGFVNLAVRLESLTFSEFKVDCTGRRYLTSMFDDEVAQKTVPLPTVLSAKVAPVPVILSTSFDGVTFVVKWRGIAGVTYDLATDTSGIESTFLFTGPGGSYAFSVLDGMTSVFLRSNFRGKSSVWVEVPISGAGTVVDGRPAPYALMFTATGPTTATATWVRNATDNDDVRYSFDGGTTKTALGSATIVTKNFTGLTADTDYSLTMFNEWSSGTQYSGPSETRTIHTPVTSPDSNDPIDLRLETSVNSHGIWTLDYYWNPQSGSDPTLHFTSSGAGSGDFNPTTTPSSYHLTLVPAGVSTYAYVTNADGSNPSNPVEFETFVV